MTRRFRTGSLTFLGLLTVGALVGGLGVWGTQARIAGAVVASGRIEVKAHRQVVQHPEGGVVQSIQVQDGDRVTEGDVLVRLDGASTRSQLAIAEGQLNELQARAARLSAERAGRRDLEFPADLLARAETDPEVASILRGQESLFRARLASRDASVQSLREQQLQIENEIKGQTAQERSGAAQLSLVAGQLADQQKLLDNGLTKSSQVMDLRRESARLEGANGETEAAIARNRGRIAQLDVEIVKVDSTLRESAESELRDIVTRKAELRERINAYNETLSRLDLRAPMTGTVYEMQVHAIKSVIRPAEPVLYIVPQTQTLVIQARVDANHVDSVHVGQDATLRFPSFDARTTPDLAGTVTRLSPDVLTDDRTGAPYYEIDVSPKDHEVERLGALKLLPGMPVEVFAQTGERSPLSYLLKPFTDYFQKAFRD